EALGGGQASYAEHEVAGRVLRRGSPRFGLDTSEIDRVRNYAYSVSWHTEVVGEPAPQSFADRHDVIGSAIRRRQKTAKDRPAPGMPRADIGQCVASDTRDPNGAAAPGERAGHQDVDAGVREEEARFHSIQQGLSAAGIPTQSRDGLEREGEIFHLTLRPRPGPRTKQAARMTNPALECSVWLEQREKEAPVR